MRKILIMLVLASLACSMSAVSTPTSTPPPVVTNALATETKGIETQTETAAGQLMTVCNCESLNVRSTPGVEGSACPLCGAVYLQKSGGPTLRPPDEKPAAAKAALPAKNILSRLFGWFSAFRR